MNETIQGVTATLEAGFDKIAKAYGIKDEYLKDAKAALSEELESMAKQAGFFGEAVKYGAGALEGAKGAMGSGAVGGAVALGGLALGGSALRALTTMAVNKIGRSYGHKADRVSYDRAFRTALEMSDILKNDPIKAKRMADTIFGFAPIVASDANVLENILSNTIHGESIDLQTVRAVTELEEKLTKMKDMRHQL